jgi:hypothetical protein
MRHDHVSPARELDRGVRPRLARAALARLAAKLLPMAIDEHHSAPGGAW